MKLDASLLTSGAGLALRSAHLAGRASNGTVQGFDISSYQPNVDFGSAYNSGARFVIIKVCRNTTRLSHILASTAEHES